MKVTRVLAVGVMAASLGFGLQSLPGQAQISDQVPAEFPPATYKGKQYVDSNGCVFIRAGIDGDVSWVPRVTRDRQVICGFRPSLAPEVAEAPAPVAEEEAAPAEVASATSAAPDTAVKPKPRRVAQAPAPKPQKPKVMRQTAPKPKPKPKVVVQPKPVAPAEPRMVVLPEGASPCVNASPLSQQYLRGSGVRCGPQEAPILPYRTAGRDGEVTGQTQIAVVPAATAAAAGNAKPVLGAGATEVTAHTRIVPKHVAENRVNTRNVTVPEGYRPVWDDDRLNPYRAEQNLEGRADMLLVWTQTVPRRLIDRRSGRDVTAKVPLIYPYTSLPQQRAELGEVTLVTKDGKLMKRIKRKPGAKPIARDPVISTRSAPKAAPEVKKESSAGNRFVQVGVFLNPDNAQQVARKIANMGLPARIGKSKRGGKTYMSVQAGPFTDGKVQGAVQRLRGAGYADAYIR